MIAKITTQEDTQREWKEIKLSDGRRLAFVEYGTPTGKPVLYSHGHPGSRLDLPMFGMQELEQSGLRLISIDRPGIGRSDFLPGRKVVDWPRDISALADVLGLQRFAVFGISGGGPFAAVIAQALPERVTKLVLASSVGQFNVPGATKGMGAGLLYFRLARYAPWLCRLQLWLMAYGVKSDKQKTAEQVIATIPPVDAAALGQPDVLEPFLQSLAEFLHQGSRGPAWEAGLYLRPWGFPLEEIRVPTYLWHGLADRNAPSAMSRELARRIPGCRASFVPGEGHFSLLKKYTAEILGTLAKEEL